MEFWQATAQRWWRSRTLESRDAVFDPFPIEPITTIGSSFRTKPKLIFETRVHVLRVGGVNLLKFNQHIVLKKIEV